MIRALTLLLLTAAGLGLAILEVLLQPMYVGAVPVPVGTVLVLLTLPLLTSLVADVSAAPAVVVSPLVVWVLAVLVFGFAGPGGDVLLPTTWQSLLLLVAGVLMGIRGVRRVLDAV